MTAVLGPNGAGKSTLLKLLSLLSQPTEGHVELGGVRANGLSNQHRRLVGYVGHKTMLYDALSATENLTFFAHLYGLSGVSTLVQRWVDAVGLGEDAHRPVSDFSRGMRQRLSIARALLHEPLVVLLDEPFTGLDQGGLKMATSMIEQARNRGAAIIMVSHDLPVASKVADHALILRRGRKMFHGPVHGDLAETYQASVQQARAGQ